MSHDDWGYRYRRSLHASGLAIDTRPPYEAQEATMTNPQPPQNIHQYPAVFGQAFQALGQHVAELTKTPEQRFRDLQLEPGDRIRLTEVSGPMTAGRRPKARDAAVIEGVILGIKEKHGGPQVRIKGFDHTGGKAGGQHIWLPVGDYHVEVLHKTFRMTPADRVIAELAGVSESAYRAASDNQRISWRQSYSKRAERIAALFAQS
jgi:hypothetical protein